ncbi:MAG TPA: energy transducer TonB [Terriglobales bacterium]|nr:energy transducer TonB [Terriglobales bacterium]
MAEAFDQLLLPERKINWRTLAASFLGQVVLLFLLVEAGLINPQRLVIATQHLTYTPLVEKTRQPEQFRPKLKAHLLPAPPLNARLIVPRDAQMHTPEAAVVAPPKVVFAAPKLAPALVRPGGAMPAIVHTGSFAGSSAAPTIVRPVERVQTGSFGDPNGVSAQGKGQGQLVLARMGGFDMPVGAGSGNGAGGMRGARGTVASAGFGGGIATSGKGDGCSSGRGNVQAGGFGDVNTQSSAPQQRTAVSAPATTPVEILSKPKPVYTEEAKRLGLQGEVLVQVLFGANGQAQVLRVMRGLGHGLDEAAVNAANKIRYKPAQQNGRPVDSTAVVHVVFELAY